MPATASQVLHWRRTHRVLALFNTVIFVALSACTVFGRVLDEAEYRNTEFTEAVTINFAQTPQFSAVGCTFGADVEVMTSPHTNHGSPIRQSVNFSDSTLRGTLLIRLGTNYATDVSIVRSNTQVIKFHTLDLPGDSSVCLTNVTADRLHFEGLNLKTAATLALIGVQVRSAALLSIESASWAYPATPERTGHEVVGENTSLALTYAALNNCTFIMDSCDMAGAVSWAASRIIAGTIVVRNTTLGHGWHMLRTDSRLEQGTRATIDLANVSSVRVVGRTGAVVDLRGPTGALRSLASERFVKWVSRSGSSVCQGVAVQFPGTGGWDWGLFSLRHEPAQPLSPVRACPMSVAGTGFFGGFDCEIGGHCFVTLATLVNTTVVLSASQFTLFRIQDTTASNVSFVLQSVRITDQTRLGWESHTGQNSFPPTGNEFEQYPRENVSAVVLRSTITSGSRIQFVNASVAGTLYIGNGALLRDSSVDFARDTSLARLELGDGRTAPLANGSHLVVDATTHAQEIVVQGSTGSSCEIHTRHSPDTLHAKAVLLVINDPNATDVASSRCVLAGAFSAAKLGGTLKVSFSRSPHDVAGAADVPKQCLVLATGNGLAATDVSYTRNGLLSLSGTLADAQLRFRPQSFTMMRLQELTTNRSDILFEGVKFTDSAILGQSHGVFRFPVAETSAHDIVGRHVSASITHTRFERSRLCLRDTRFTGAWHLLSADFVNTSVTFRRSSADAVIFNSFRVFRGPAYPSLFDRQSRLRVLQSDIRFNVKVEQGFRTWVSVPSLLQLTLPASQWRVGANSDASCQLEATFTVPSVTSLTFTASNTVTPTSAATTAACPFRLVGQRAAGTLDWDTATGVLQVSASIVDASVVLQGTMRIVSLVDSVINRSVITLLSMNVTSQSQVRRFGGRVVFPDRESLGSAFESVDTSVSVAFANVMMDNSRVELSNMTTAGSVAVSAGSRWCNVSIAVQRCTISRGIVGNHAEELSNSTVIVANGTAMGKLILKGRQVRVVVETKFPSSMRLEHGLWGASAVTSVPSTTAAAQSDHELCMLQSVLGVGRDGVLQHAGILTVSSVDPSTTPDEESSNCSVTLHLSDENRADSSTERPLFRADELVAVRDLRFEADGMLLFDHAVFDNVSLVVAHVSVAGFAFMHTVLLHSTIVVDHVNVTGSMWINYRHEAGIIGRDQTVLTRVLYNTGLVFFHPTLNHTSVLLSNVAVLSGSVDISGTYAMERSILAFQRCSLHSFVLDSRGTLGLGATLALVAGTRVAGTVQWNPTGGYLTPPAGIDRCIAVLDGGTLVGGSLSVSKCVYGIIGESAVSGEAQIASDSGEASAQLLERVRQSVADLQSEYRALSQARLSVQYDMPFLTVADAHAWRAVFSGAVSEQPADGGDDDCATTRDGAFKLLPTSSLTSTASVTPRWRSQTASHVARLDPTSTVTLAEQPPTHQPPTDKPAPHGTVTQPVAGDESLPPHASRSWTLMETPSQEVQTRPVSASTPPPYSQSESEDDSPLGAAEIDDSALSDDELITVRTSATATLVAAGVISDGGGAALDLQALAVSSSAIGECLGDEKLAGVGGEAARAPLSAFAPHVRVLLLCAAVVVVAGVQVMVAAVLATMKGGTVADRLAAIHCPNLPLRLLHLEYTSAVVAVGEALVSASNGDSNISTPLTIVVALVAIVLVAYPAVAYVLLRRHVLRHGHHDPPGGDSPAAAAAPKADEATSKSGIRLESSALYAVFGVAFAEKPRWQRRFVLPEGWWPVSDARRVFGALVNAARGPSSLWFVPLPFLRAIVLALASEVLTTCAARIGAVGIVVGGLAVFRAWGRPLRVGLMQTAGNLADAGTVLVMVLSASSSTRPYALPLMGIVSSLVIVASIGGLVMRLRFQKHWVKAEETAATRSSSDAAGVSVVANDGAVAHDDGSRGALPGHERPLLEVPQRAARRSSDTACKVKAHHHDRPAAAGGTKRSSSGDDLLPAVSPNNPKRREHAPRSRNPLRQKDDHRDVDEL